MYVDGKTIVVWILFVILTVFLSIKEALQVKNLLVWNIFHINVFSFCSTGKTTCTEFMLSDVVSNHYSESLRILSFICST